MTTRVPVVRGRVPVRNCDACRAKDTLVHLVVLEGRDCSICIDFMSCVARYRMGLTPEMFRNYLKAENVLAATRYRAGVVG